MVEVAAVMLAADLLNQFAASSDVYSQRDALIALVKAKQLHQVAHEEPFRKGLVKAADTVQRSEIGKERLLGVALLERTAAVAKSLRPEIDSLLIGSLTKPLPDLEELTDADDRLYAARSWRGARCEWFPEVLARSAAAEESAENVRRECLEGVVELTSDIAAVFRLLGTAFRTIVFGTKKPGDSRARRLKRLLSPVETLLSTSDKPAGQNPGRELSRIVETSFPRNGLPESDQVKVTVAHQIAALIHQVVRSRLSRASDSRTYDALAVVSEWFSPDDWRDVCESSDHIARVRGDITEGLLALARQSVPDERLRQALVTACGSAAVARRLCRRIATDDPGISKEIRDWLAGARRRRRSTAASESRERSIDEVLAELLVDMKSLSRASAVVQASVLPDVNVILPQSASALSRLTGMADAVVNKMDLAIGWRSLRTRGEVGNEVEFSPIEHRFVSDGARTRRVRIVRPAVERVSADGVPHIVMKAFVEPARDTV